jgi:hypothetical protein
MEEMVSTRAVRMACLLDANENSLNLEFNVNISQEDDNSDLSQEMFALKKIRNFPIASSVDLPGSAKWGNESGQGSST